MTYYQDGVENDAVLAYLVAAAWAATAVAT
jgi:hypothetical protein